MKKYMKGKKDGEKPGESGSSFEQLGRMAAQQAAIKKQLQEMAQELNKDGSGKGNSLKDLIKKIEETEDEIINNEISLSSIERQEEIKVKLLELDKASKEQEEEEKREAKESIDDYKKNNSILFEEYLEIKKGEIELLKTIPPNLKPYYKNKVNEYFKSIEKDYD
jgi:predicted P-loop ATPase